VLTPERFDTDETNVELGYHRKMSPTMDLAVVATYNDLEQTSTLFDLFTGTGTDTIGKLSGPQLEVQDVWRQGRITWTFGAGLFDGEFRIEDAAGNGVEANDRYLNGYAYAKIRDIGPLEVTGGLAIERVDSPTGMLPPRDSNMFVAPITFEDSQLSPKLSVSWFATPSTVVRAAGYSRLSPFLGRVQSLEPTQVGGFNQFFEEPGGTSSQTFGAGVDQRFGGRLFAGLNYIKRSMDIPEPYCEFPDDFSGCNFQQVDRVIVRDGDDTIASAYVEGAMGKRLTGRIEYASQDSEFDVTQVSQTGIFEDRVRTQRLVPELRLMLPIGLFAVARGNYYNQKVDQFDQLSSPLRSEVEAEFWTADFSVGMRFPDRWGSIVLDVTNLTDREYDFYLPSLQDTVIPARRAVLRLNVTY